MAIVSDGTGTYVKRTDRTKDYGSMTKFKIGDRLLYDLDQKTGTLKISISPGDLEILLEEMEKNGAKVPPLKENEYLEMPLPWPFNFPARFKGVKKVESMPGVKEGEYLFKISYKESV